VETVPTPKENILLLDYFWKRSILNALRPCSLAARHFAQKHPLLLAVRPGRVRPVPTMAEI
jgi:hypothetical protein